MNRAEYLNQLNKYLKKLPESDYKNAMEYFTEYFDEVGEQRVIEELGTPKEAAVEILNNLLGQNIEDGQDQEKGGAVSGKRMGFFVYLPILKNESGFCGVAGAFLFFWVVLLVLLGVSVVGIFGAFSLLWLGGKYFIYGITAVSHSLSGASMMAGMGIFGIGVGFLVLTGTVLAGRLIFYGSTQLIKNLILKRRGKK